MGGSAETVRASNGGGGGYSGAWEDDVTSGSMLERQIGDYHGSGGGGQIGTDTGRRFGISDRPSHSAA